MDEQNIPIDINTNKLLEWLVSRRHVNKDWQNNIIKVREKINNAIQDMPAHEGIVKLLSGQHINYFHCLKIIEILKETEADSKNLFGRYGSQRMKDWQDVISLYQKDNLYLAEAAQIIIRNVSYEIPGLKKQITKLEQNQLDCEKKIKEYSKVEATALKEFHASCEQLGISGKNIKKELLELIKGLPDIYRSTAENIKLVKPAVDLYIEFNNYLAGKEAKIQCLIVLKYLIEQGNTTTYEYTYGEKPIEVIETFTTSEEGSTESDNIDFGEIDFGNNGNSEIEFEINTDNSIDFGDVTVGEEQQIDWGSTTNEEGFEIVSHDDVSLNLEESGIVVEKTGTDGGIATGDDALTILDNPKTREQIINNLLELSSFLKMRIFEMSNESDHFSVSQMQDTPTLIQMQTLESVTALNDSTNIAIEELTNKRIQHLYNIKHSPKYVDNLTASLNQKLSLVEKMKANKTLLEKKIQSLGEEVSSIQPFIKTLIIRTKELQRDIEEDISKKYKGRPVNIVGGINML